WCGIRAPEGACDGSSAVRRALCAFASASRSPMFRHAREFVLPLEAGVHELIPDLAHGRLEQQAHGALAGELRRPREQQPRVHEVGWAHATLLLASGHGGIVFWFLGLARHSVSCSPVETT